MRPRIAAAMKRGETSISMELALTPHVEAMVSEIAAAGWHAWITGNSLLNWEEVLAAP
jgi:hypothetical protein